MVCGCELPELAEGGCELLELAGVGFGVVVEASLAAAIGRPCPSRPSPCRASS